jgi:hypothetical protein
LPNDKAITDVPDRDVRGLCKRPEQRKMLRHLNEQHAVIYTKRRESLEKKLNATTLKLALEQRESEAKRGISISHWSFELAVEDAAKASALVTSEQARKGGSSKKTDVLQALIVRIVREKPSITELELLKKLKAMSHGEAIEDIDDVANLKSGEKPQIHFQSRDGGSRFAPVSGLKHRLSRARKIVEKDIAQTR